MPAVTGNNFYIDKHDLHFRTGTANVATINYDTSDESISLNVAGTGAINIGDAGGDIFIGDGTSETDIVFEQNGAIRALTNKTLTLGQTDSNVTIAAQNFTISGTGVVTDMSGRLQVRNIEATDNNSVGWAGTDNQVGTIYMSDESRGLLGNMGGGYARSLIRGGSNTISIGSSGTSVIRKINYLAGSPSATDSEHNFYTSGNNLRMHIAKNGNVGIGTNDPAAKLEITGDTTTYDGMAKIYLTDGSSNSASRNWSIGNGGSAYGNLTFAVSAAKGGVAGDATSTNAMVIANDGKVGIGVIDPDATLEVKGAGNTDATTPFVVRRNNDGILLKVRDDGVVTVERNYFYASASAGAYVQNDLRVRGSLFNDQGTLAINGDVNFDSDTLYVDSTNNRVGIGTTSLIKELQVNGSVLTKNNGGYLSYDFQGNVATILNLTTANELSIGQASHVDSMSFNVGGTDDAMFIDSSANVGIGVANPDTKLEVAGVIKSSSTSRVQADVYNNSANSANIIYRSSTSTIVGNNADALVVLDGGNVGIGTNSPDNKLHVETSDNEVAKFESTDAKGYIEIKDNTYSSYVGINSTAGAASFGGKVDGAADTGNLNISTINGKVGIGTTSFSEQLGVKPDTDVSAEIGKAHVGYIGFADYAGFSHVDRNSTSDYALLQSAGGSTFLNKANGYEIYFRNNNNTIGGFNTANDFYVDTDTLYVDTSNDRVGVNTNTPSRDLQIGNGGSNAVVAIVASNTALSQLAFGDTDDDNYGQILVDHSTNKLQIQNGGGGPIIDRGITLDSSENVGIGTATPDKQLHISHATQPYLRLEESSSGGEKRLDLFVSSSTGVIAANQSAQTMMFQTANATRMTIASDGDVGIGTTNPTSKLHVKGPINITRTVNTATSNIDMEGNFRFIADNGYRTTFFNNGVERVRFDVNGNVGIGTNSPGETLDVVGFIRMGNATANSTQKIARQVVRAYNTSHNDFMAFMGTANETSNVVSYGGGSNDQTCATKLAFYTHTNVSTSTAGTQRMHINSIGKVGIGAATSFSTDHAGMKLQICAEDTSPSLNTTAIDDCSLVISNEDEDYGTVFAVKSNGIGQIQQRRMSAATYYSLELQPFGGNVGVGTESPSDKLQVNGSFSASSKTFNIEHPTQSGKRLIHGCFEGPEHGVYFRGKTQDSGIQAPEYWSGLVDIDSMTVDVTPIGPNQSIYVDRIEDNGDVYVGANTSEPLNYFYIIYGERKDVDKLEVVKDNPPPDTGIA